MKKLLCLVLSVCMIATMFAMPVLAEDASTTASAQGFASPVTVTLTIDGSKLTNVEIDASGETPALGGAAAANMAEAMLATNSVEVDAVAGATFTSNAVLTAAAEALAQSGASLEAKAVSAVAFVPGTYEGTGTGCNGAITVAVTFTENAIEKIEVVASRETAQVGTPAFDIMIPEMIDCTSTGVDSVSGATFTSNGLKEAVTDAAVKAGCDPVAIRTGAKPFVVEAGEPVEATYDVVVIGAGGAGIAAAAQAAQDGNTVLVIEKNAQVGGNTLVSGGQYQSVMPYLVWDPADPDAETGVGFDGNTYNKVKESANTLKELKVILNWSEEAFDEEFYKTNEFVAGDIEELSKHGVHAEYLDTLKALKAEIQAYLDWAQPKVDAGEGTLTLFSTLNLHIFQTYYGGLRPTADMSSWIYGDYDLVSQFINDGQELKPWLEAQGSTFVEDTQPTLIGALWYRENQYIGAEIDGVFTGDRWGTYFVAPMNTLLNTSATAKENKIMTRTDAKELIVDNGRVVGVKATMFDGTPVTAMATKGVVLATGGYAANLDKVLSTNVYWSSEYISARTKTTNRSSLRGDGIAMGEAVGAATTGEGFTQMMPISWIDDGNLAFGGGNYAVYLNPVTGKRFVDETSERDVLSLAEFRNGIEVNGTKGVFIEVANLEQPIPGPYPYTTEDVEWRQYIRTTDQFAELFASLGLPTDAETVIETIKNYDAAIMAGVEPEGVNKTNANRIIGNADKDERGNYIPETYTLDGVALRVRFMAPSTHHTMGGLKVDVDRHVISTEGSIIPGLYAAGEVTGGIHGGNRLGGNAIVEIFVSGRTAAKAISADN